MASDRRLLTVCLIISCIHNTFSAPITQVMDGESSLIDLLRMCQTAPHLCDSKSGITRRALVSIRHNGIQKRAAILMTEILEICINKGVTDCDVKDTVIALDALSSRLKSATKEHSLAQPQRRHGAARLLRRIRRSEENSRERRSIDGILRLIMRASCHQDPSACQSSKNYDIPSGYSTI